MRTEPAELPDLADQGLYASADWRATPDAVLAALDPILNRYGLEIVMVQPDSDTHVFRLDRYALSNYRWAHTNPLPQGAAPAPRQSGKPHLKPEEVRVFAALTDQWQTSRQLGVSHHLLKRLMKYGLVECTQCALYPDIGPHYGYRLKGGR